MSRRRPTRRRLDDAGTVGPPRRARQQCRHLAPTNRWHRHRSRCSNACSSVLSGPFLSVQACSPLMVESGGFNRGHRFDRFDQRRADDRRLHRSSSPSGTDQGRCPRIRQSQHPLQHRVSRRGQSRDGHRVLRRSRCECDERSSQRAAAIDTTEPDEPSRAGRSTLPPQRCISRRTSRAIAPAPSSSSMVGYTPACTSTCPGCSRRDQSELAAGSHATVDVDHLAIDIARVVRAQESDDIGDLCGIARRVSWGRSCPFVGAITLIVDRGALAHDEAGADRVRTDVVPSELDGHGLGE